MKQLKNLYLVAAGLTLATPAIAASTSCNGSAAAQPPALQESAFYQPFLAMQAEMNRMNREMNQLFEEAFFKPQTQGFQPGQYYSSYSMEMTPKEYRIRMSGSNFNDKNMKVDVSNGNLLTISNPKGLVQKTGGNEHASNPMTEAIELPADADTTHMQTSFKDGQYTVILPRKTSAASSTKPTTHEEPVREESL